MNKQQINYWLARAKSFQHGRTLLNYVHDVTVWSVEYKAVALYQMLQ